MSVAEGGGLCRRGQVGAPARREEQGGERSAGSGRQDSGRERTGEARRASPGRGRGLPRIAATSQATTDDAATTEHGRAYLPAAAAPPDRSGGLPCPKSLPTVAESLALPSLPPPVA